MLSSSRVTAEHSLPLMHLEVNIKRLPPDTEEEKPKKKKVYIAESLK